MSTTPSPSQSLGDLTLLLQRVERGEEQAADRLLPMVYNQLRQLAAARMARESPGQTLQPTALVHEAWLRLGGDQQPRWENRAQFFSAAAEAMRRIVIDGARKRSAVRHGGALQKVSASETGFDLPSEKLDDTELMLLNEALDSLAVHEPRKAELVKQWYFVGLTLAEVAKVMGISERTVSREWAYARAWLMKEIDRLR